jgi:hypothetical protein
LEGNGTVGQAYKFKKIRRRISGLHSCEDRGMKEEIKDVTVGYIEKCHV